MNAPVAVHRAAAPPQHPTCCVTFGSGQGASQPRAKEKDVKSSLRSPSMALNEASENDVMIDANCSETEPIAR